MRHTSTAARSMVRAVSRGQRRQGDAADFRGIDSPVAGYMMAKRGLEISAIHFVSPPYTSERAKQKVIDLAQKMCSYCGRIKLHIVPFTEIQEAIRDQCPEDLFTIIMRRYMMKIACRVARLNECEALITGESVGQVASQTIQAIACTNEVCDMPGPASGHRYGQG